MGKQIRLFISSKDEISLFKDLKKNGFLLLNEKQEEINEANLEFSKPKSVFITKEGAVISSRESGLIDQLSSEVIQFIRSIKKEKEKEVWEGGLWLKPSFYDSKNNIVKKPEWLNNLYSYCKKWVKNNLKFDKRNDLYISENIYMLYKQGYKMKNAPKINLEFD